MLPEPTTNLTLTDEAVRTAAVDRLRPALGVQAQGYKVSTDMLLDALVYAAAAGTSLHGAAAELSALADDTTLRDHLNGAVNASFLNLLDQRLSAALMVDLPAKVFEGRWQIAIDLHDQPFYGTSPELRAYACRGEARDGTTYFFRVATAYLILDGLRLNLALTFVLPGYDLANILAVLVERVQKRGIRIGRLWLDRGFAAVGVIRYLQCHALAAVIGCPIRGKSGGTRALCVGRSSYLTRYTFQNPELGPCTVNMAVVRGLKRGRRRKRKAHWHLYILINTKLTPAQVHGRYRSRFGIESSYRTMRQVRIRTSSRNPAWRFVCMAIGFILVNVWVTLRFLYCQIPRRGRGGRPLDYARLRLRRLSAFLRLAIERRYPPVRLICATTLPLHAEIGKY